MEPLPYLQEVEMIHLSRDIPHSSYSELCMNLGYSHNLNRSILSIHLNDYNEAMKDILTKWSTEQADSSRSRSILAKKLDDVKLGGLGKKLSKGEYLHKQQDPQDQAVTSLQGSSGIYSKKISDSLTVQQCREKLENKYINRLCKIPMKPWDQTDYAEFKDMHTVVTMVTKDARGQNTKKKEILQDSVAGIFSTKVNGRLPARILISAPAGRGKTTAVAKMAYDWVHREKGSALELLPLLFVVKFRNTNQLTSIGEAIKSQLLSDVDDLTPEGLESFIRENQGICHIILDGLDEYAGISSSNRSSESNIVSVIRWEEFPECRVLVTTRPHLDNLFDQAEISRVYTHMWIEGFSQESSREYIDKFFASTSNPCRGHGLKVYLDDQPLINELVKTPLFCLMVCHLWSEGMLNTDTATQTELFDSVNVFLMHHANARSILKDEITEEELIEIIRKLGKVALAGLLDDSKKLLFTPHDFRRVPSILDRACELGIVSKVTIATTRLPRSNETTSKTIEFYHKLVQEHSAGKYLAAKTKKYMLRLKISKLDRLLRNIEANIGDYENLIRFAAGTYNRLCIRIMEALLSNRFLDESERYRILLDCSSEIKGTRGNVSSLVQKCVTAQSIVLKSPTVYTVVGMNNLPKELKHKVKTVKFEGSSLTTDVTSGLWSCLRSFTSLNHLSISDSYLSFPPSPPELLSVTKLSAERVTSQSYGGVLSSVPGVRQIDVSINVAELETSNIFQIATASRPMGQTRARDEQFLVHIRLLAWPAPTADRKIESGETIGELSLLFGDQTRNQQRLHVSGMKGRDEAVLVDLFVKTSQLTSLNSGSGNGPLNDRDDVENTRFEIQQCQLSTKMTEKLWSCLRSITSLNQLSISDSSLSFPPSPSKLPSVTKLSAERMTSQSYEEVLSSLPGVRQIDVSVNVAQLETSNTFQIATASRPMGQTRPRDEQLLVHIRLLAWPALTTDRKIESGEIIGELSLLFGDQTRNQQRLHVSGVKGRDEAALVNLFVKTTQITSLNSGGGDGPLNDRDDVENTRFEIQQCQLSTKMTEKLWSCLRSFTSLNQLTISDSSLSFPPYLPELPSVTKLSAERMTSQSYEGVLSSLPGVRQIDVSVNVAQLETSNTFQIATASRPIGQTRPRDEQLLVYIRLLAWPALTTDRKIESGETIGELSLLFGDQTRNQQRLHVSGMKGRDEAALVDLFVKTSQLTSLNSGSGDGPLNDIDAVENTRFEIQQCQLSTEMTVKLWSFLRSVTSPNQLGISDSSLSFPPYPPKLSSVTKLSAERVTSQSYEGVLSSLPGVRQIDVSINVAQLETSNTFQIATASRPIGQTRPKDEQLLVHIRLLAWPALTADRKIESGETIGELSLLYGDQTRNQQRLHVSGMKARDEAALVHLFVKTTQLTSLNSGSGDGSLNDRDAVEKTRFEIQQCQLSTEMTEKLWSCLRSFTSLNQLGISDSSLCFTLSPPELPSVTKLSAERVTSQSYEGLLSSLPGLRDIDIIIDDAEKDIAQITACLRRTGGQQLTHIKLIAPPSLPSGKNCISGETMRGLDSLIREQITNLQWLGLSGMKSLAEEDLVELVESSTYLKALDSQHLESIDYESFKYDRQSDVQCLYFTRCEQEKILEGLARRAEEVLPKFQDLHTAATGEVSISKARISSIDEQHVDEDGSSATGIFGALGGELSSESHGFTLHIPPGALEEDQKISLGVLTEIPNGLTLKYDEVLVSHGFQCYPSGLCFNKPAKLIIPHCAIVTAPNKILSVLYSWNQSGTPTRLPHSSDIICSVQERWLEVSISRFSGGYFALIWDLLFLKGILLSCLSFLPRVLPYNRQPVLEVRFVKMLHDKNWNDGDGSYQPVKDEDDYVVFRRSTLTVSCQLGETSPETDSYQAIQYSDLSSKTKEIMYFPLNLTERSDETLVTLSLVQTTTQTIKFNTHFQGITASPRPEASTSVDIAPQDASAAAGEVSTSRERDLSVNEQHEHEAVDKYHSEGIFDKTGGELHIPSYGLTLSIPPGALPEGSVETITLDVLTDVPLEFPLRHDETLVTYGFRCLPSGIQFVSGKPVKLKISHCANLIDPNKVQVVMYSMNHEGEVDRIVQTSRTCRVTYTHVEILLEHFSNRFLTFIRDLLSMRDKRMSFMPFLPKIMPQSREMMLEFRMVNKPHGNFWRDVHKFGEEAEYQPVKDDDDEMNVKDDDMAVTCQLNGRATLTENVDAGLIRDTKHTVYFNLDFNGKADDLPVELKVIQSMITKDIKFRTHFLAHRGITETSPGKTDFASPRLSASTSVDIPLQGASAAGGEVYTSKARPTVESMDQNFDDLLKTVAKHICKDIDIDNLGVKLGFETPDIELYMKKNRQDNTFTGTLYMLRDWRKRTKRSGEREQLTQALIAIGHQRLADDHLKDDMASLYEQGK